MGSQEWRPQNKGLQGITLSLSAVDYTVKATEFAANLFLLSRTSSNAHKTYTGQLEHNEESLTPGVPSKMSTLKRIVPYIRLRRLVCRRPNKLRPSPPHLAMLEFCLELLELSSPHHALSDEYRFYRHPSKPCFEGKGCSKGSRFLNVNQFETSKLIYSR